MRLFEFWKNKETQHNNHIDPHISAFADLLLSRLMKVQHLNHNIPSLSELEIIEKRLNAIIGKYNTIKIISDKCSEIEDNIESLERFVDQVHNLNNEISSIPTLNEIQEAREIINDLKGKRIF